MFTTKIEVEPKKMTEQKPKYKPDKKLWQSIAIIAGAFSFVICMLIIVNYIQINRINPVETETIDALVNRLSQNPEDQQLREQIRTLDLLARKAYFTNQWQIRMGGYLLFIGVIIVIISMQMILSVQKKTVNLKPENKNDLIFTQKQTRKWITGFSVVLVSVTLIFAFLTYRQLGNNFNKTLAQISQPINEIQIIESETPAVKPQDKIFSDEQIIEKKEKTILPEKPKTSETNKPEIKSEPPTTEVVILDDILPEQQPKPDSANKTPEPTNQAPVKTEPIKQTNSFASDIPGFNYEIPFPEKYANNYSTFRGPGGNGIAFQKNIPISWNGETGENILWKTEIPLEGFNSPIIWDNKIFLTGASKTKREVYCFNRETGEILWIAPVENIPGSPETTPKIPDYTGYAASTAATDGKNVYVIFANADVAAFDFNGKMVWGLNLGLPDNHYGYASSLLVYDDKVIIQWDQRNVAKVMALSTETGKTVWETNRNVKISWASPVIAATAQGPQLILAADPLVISYNPKTGHEIWQIKCLSGEVGPSVAVGGEMIFALNEYASLVGIKSGDQPKVVWEDYDYLSDVPCPVATDKYLIVPTSYGVIACYNAQSGQKHWEAEFDNSIYASPIIAEGKVYLIDMQGIMHIFKADKTYESIGEMPLGEGSVCTPAFSNGRIYIRGYKHLFCIGE